MDAVPSSVDDVILKHVFDLLQRVIQESFKRSKNDEVSRALLYLLVRVSNTWRSIKTLWKYTPESYKDGFTVDAGTLLRAMFDAYLQAEYIVHSPDSQRDRAKAYLDFEIVEKYKISTKLIAHNHPLSDYLKSSHARATGEKVLAAEFDRVKRNYLAKSGQRTRNTWYKGTLLDVARDVGKEVEYDFFVSTLHGCVHSSAFAVHKGPSFSPNYVIHWASSFAARVAYINVEYNRIVLSDFQRGLLDKYCMDYAELARSQELHSPESKADVTRQEKVKPPTLKK